MKPLFNSSPLHQNVPDYAAVYRHFFTFAEATVIRRGEEKITEDDIDLFLDKFLSVGFFFWHEGVKIPHANNVDPETKTKPFDMSDKSTKEAREELKPLLMLKVQETFGNVSDDPNDGGWDPTPTSQEDFARMFYIEGGGTSDEWEELSELEKHRHPAFTKAQLRSKRIKAYISKYFDRVMPFMLRKTMHHPISIGQYYTRTVGERGRKTIRDDEFGNPVILNSEEEMQKFLSVKKYTEEFPGGKNSGNRYLFWSPTTDGKDVKMMAIDIDNPAKIPVREVRKAVKDIASKLMREGHPTIIMFTGGDYQIWIGSNGKNPLGNQNEAADYVTSTLYGMGALTKEDAINNEVIWIDRSTLDKTQQIRMFFSLHYPSEDSKEPTKFSGLAAVPVTIDDMMTFEPFEHAHPDTVRKNFDAYASVVAAWFDEVQIGQDYDSPGDVKSAPECAKLETQHPTYSYLDYVHTKANTIGITPSEIAVKTADEPHVFAYSKQRGVNAILRYDSKGGLKFGKIMTKEKVSTDKRGDTKLSTVEVKSVFVTKKGIVVHSDYLTRELERYCIGAGIKELTLVGQVIMTDEFGTEQDIQDIQSVLAKKDGLDASDMKKVRFICSYIASYNYDEVPLTAMEEELSKISTGRIFPAPSFDFTTPVGKKLIRAYNSNRDQRLGKDMVIMGEENYFVTSQNKISMAIVGVDRQSKFAKSEAKQLGPVYVGLIKEHSKKGPIYYLVGKAEIALTREESIKLKKMVYGDNRRNLVPLNIDRDDIVEMIDVVEPTVVVDVIYDDVSSTKTNALPFHFLPSSRGRSYRSVEASAFVTKIIGAKIVGIRSDLNAMRPPDISYKQEPLLHISAFAPKQGFSILNTLPNPSKKVDFYEYYTARMPEVIDKHTPWQMSPKAYSKLNKLSKSEIVGFVKKKSIIYDDDPGWSIVGDYDELMDSAFTFKKITKPFSLRGLDVINATKMAAEYGINYHLIISEGSFYWIFCEIESESLKGRRDELFTTGKDKGVKSILSDMLDVVSSLYSPEEQVTDAVVPGFKLDILVVQEIKANPAFSGVNSHMGSFYSSPVDAIPLDEPKLMSEIYKDQPEKWKYSNDYLYQIGGTKVKPHLFDSKLTRPRGFPAEFEKAYKRWNDDEEGFKVYVDKYSENTTGDAPYFKYTGLPLFMHNAVDDHKNAYGIDGVSIISMGNTIDKAKSYREAFNATKLVNKEQAKEDMKIVAAQLNSFPGQGTDWRQADSDFRGYDNIYKAQHKKGEADLKKALKTSKFKGLTQVIESALSNPPVKRSAWSALVTDYIDQYKQWNLDPEPKELWEKYSLGLFPTWAVPLLEKERFFNLAQSQYELSEEDVKIINSNLVGNTTGAVFDPIFSDLYEEEEEEEDEEEDSEDEFEEYEEEEYEG